jgi:27-O-demethylrifamycin SV methyltransferase
MKEDSGSIAEAPMTSQRQTLSAQPRDHYDRVTEAWQYVMGDDLHVGYFSDTNQDLFEATRALTSLMAEHARIEAGSRVLDIGCGTGNPALYLATERGCHVSGISNSHAGIERAKARAAEKSADHGVSFCVGEATATGFVANSFDCVWVMESSHLIPQKELLVQECVRVLRPGGTTVLCDLMLLRPLPSQPNAAMWRDLLALERAYGKANLQSQELYVRQFEACGMDAEGFDISQNVAPTFQLWRTNAEEHSHLIAEILGVEQLNYFIKSCEIMTRLFNVGQFGYCVVKGSKRI